MSFVTNTPVGYTIKNPTTAIAKPTPAHAITGAQASTSFVFFKTNATARSETKLSPTPTAKYLGYGED